MSKKSTGKTVPSGRLVRAGRLGAMAGRVATSMLTEGAGQWLKGKRPSWSSLLLTPANLSRITEQLATMRGAAMKLGQLISMDSGDFLPEELSTILGRLREDAHPMPREQLQAVLDDAWGAGWQDNLLYFSFAPIAAASIGQVHKAITMDGETLAIKVQYPGVRDSISSDVDNVATLIRLSGLVPGRVDLAPLLGEAKTQLEQEADYLREAAMLRRYQALIDDEPSLVMPDVYDTLTTDTVLAMRFLKSEPLDVLQGLPQADRDSLMSTLMRLFFKEVFDAGLIQSDPNLANYRLDTENTRIALLDFGATRELSNTISNGYRELLNAAATSDRERMRSAALAIGLIHDEHSEAQQEAVLDIGMLACESIRQEGVYDFGQSTLISRLQPMGMALTFDLDFWHTPPADALFIHRKLGGLFLLAKRFRARINMRDTARPWLDQT
ncbi:ABC1 kinase family protein [Alteromonas sp. CYL-A6]|uniref:ABC1 kinase family protein n=1 Tax=Alteromonas nitratireducens TaxID=3390813 RepID=UPI0034AA7BBB